MWKNRKPPIQETDVSISKERFRKYYINRGYFGRYDTCWSCHKFFFFGFLILFAVSGCTFPTPKTIQKRLEDIGGELMVTFSQSSVTTLTVRCLQTWKLGYRQYRMQAPTVKSWRLPRRQVTAVTAVQPNLKKTGWTVPAFRLLGFFNENELIYLFRMASYDVHDNYWDQYSVLAQHNGKIKTVQIKRSYTRMTSSWQKKRALFVESKKKKNFLTLRGRTAYNYSTIYTSRMPKRITVEFGNDNEKRIHRRRPQ